MAYVVDAAFASSGNWRLMFASGVLPALALGFGIATLPESPRWLLLNHRKDEALKVLTRIRGSADITAEVNDILAHAETGHIKVDGFVFARFTASDFLGRGTSHHSANDRDHAVDEPGQVEVVVVRPADDLVREPGDTRERHHDRARQVEDDVVAGAGQPEDDVVLGRGEVAAGAAIGSLKPVTPPARCPAPPPRAPAGIRRRRSPRRSWSAARAATPPSDAAAPASAPAQVQLQVGVRRRPEREDAGLR